MGIKKTSNLKIQLHYITHYAQLLSPDADGICIMKTCEALTKTGLEVELFVPDKDLPQKASLQDELYHFYEIQEKFPIRTLKASNYYKAGFLGRTLYKSISVLRNKRTDNSIFYFRHIETALIAAISGRKTVLAHHDLSFVENHFGLKLLIYLSNKLPIRFISVTKHGAARLEALGAKKEHILVVPNGVTIEKYSKKNLGYSFELKRKYNIPQKQPLIIFSGSLFPGRGIDELIITAHRNSNLHFVIIGGMDSDIQKYKNLVKSSNVQFLGFVSPKKLPSLLCLADILIMPYTSQTPTYKDMSPMKMFDYLATGRPMVATDFPVIREILTDKVNAVLVPPNESKYLTEGILWLMNHPIEAERIGQQAKLDANLYTWYIRGQKIASWIHEQFSLDKK